MPAAISAGVRAETRGMVLALGFATTLAMWAIAYVALMKPGLIVGEILFAVTLGCILAGGFIAGRHARLDEAGWLAGLKVGLVAASLNLLLIGSLVGGRGSGHPEKMRLALAIWALANYGLSIALGAFGGAIGGLRRQTSEMNWFNRFICVAAATVFLLLITGGLVTGLEAGLAVPDWPNSFGHNMLLYPLSEMVGGIYYEHAHRLYGMLVGVSAITLAVSMFFFDRRRWLRTLGIVYLLMVCAQGVLGGTRVTQTSITLAIVHGVFAQIVFATVVSMAAFTSTTWKSATRGDGHAGSSIDRAATTTLVGLLLLQLGLGALYRHLNADPAGREVSTAILLAHVIMAGIVLLVAVFAGGRAWGMNKRRPVLPALGGLILLIVGLQITLGVGALLAVWSRPPTNSVIPRSEIILTTAHQATGALFLAAATLLMLWTRRFMRPS